MSKYLELKKELKERYKTDALTKTHREVLERAIFEDLKKEQGKCAKCWRTDNLSLDHIVPKDILRMFGMDIDREILEGNYRIMCKACNHFKGNKLDFAEPRTKELLLELIKKI